MNTNFDYNVQHAGCQLCCRQRGCAASLHMQRACLVPPSPVPCCADVLQSLSRW